MAAIRMEMQHIAVINRKQHKVTRSNSNTLVLNEGKQFAILYLASRKLVTKHTLSGKFVSEKVIS